MTTKLLPFSPLFVIIFILLPASQLKAQCYIAANVYPREVCAGDKITLSATGGCGHPGMGADFASGTMPAGWFSQGADPSFDRPCSPGMAHFWAGATPSYTRTLTTEGFDIPSGDCEIQWYMRYGAQPVSGECNAPDLPGEGVSLQWSTNDGASWTTFSGYNQYPQGTNHYIDHGGGQGDSFFGITHTPGSGGGWEPPGVTSSNYPPEGKPAHVVYYWHRYESAIPVQAATQNTRFRWVQLSNSGQGHDAWGIGEVSIVCSSTLSISWSHGPTVLNPPSVTLPDRGPAPYDTCFYVTISSVFSSATDTACVTVYPVPQVSFSAHPNPVCLGDTVHFLNTSVPDNSSWLWAFGDGEWATTKEPAHYYDSTGAYKVKLEAVYNMCQGRPEVDTVIVEHCTGAREHTAAGEINIYPNPTKGDFDLEIRNIHDNAINVCIFNASGKEIICDDIQRSSESGYFYRIHLSHQPKGVYFIKVSGSKTCKTKKLIIK